MRILKIVIIAALISLCLIGGLSFALHSLDFNKYKGGIESFFHKKYGLQSKVYGEITPSIFPTPHLTTSIVHIYDDLGNEVLRADKLDFYVGITELFNLSSLSKVGKVRIRDASIDGNFIIDEAKKSQLKRADFPEISFTNTSLSLGEHCMDCVLLSEFNLNLGDGGESLYIATDFENNGVRYSFEADFHEEGDDSMQAKVSLKNDFFEWSTDGKVKNLFGAVDEILVDGKSSLTVNNFKNFMEGIDRTSLDSYRKKEISVISSFKEFAFSADSAVSMKNGLFEFSNLSIASKGIHELKPKLVVDLLEKEISVDFDIEKIDLSEFLHLDERTKIENFARVFAKYFQSESGFNLTDLFAVLFDVKLQEMKVDNLRYTDFVLRGGLVEGKLSINQGKVNFPGNSTIKFSGSTSHNGIRDRFDSHFELSTEDSSSWSNVGAKHKGDLPKSIFLQTNISIIPHRIRISKMRAALDDSLIVGNFAILTDAMNKQKINGSAHLNKVDLDKFGVDSALDNFIFILFRGDEDKTGKTYFRLLDDYKWLRYMDFEMDVDLVTEKLLFKKQLYNQVLSSLSFSPGKMELENISLNSDLINLKGDFSLSIPGFKPKVKSELNFQFLDTRIVDVLFPSLDVLRQKAAPEKKVTNAERDKINLFSINNFDGWANFKIDKLIHNDRIIENAKLNLQVANGAVIINNLEADIFSGKLKAVGNISALEAISPTAIHFAFNNINPGDFLREIIGDGKLQGYMSMSGSASTSGVTWSAAKKMLNAKISLIGRNIFWEGFDIDKIISSTEVKLSKDDRMKQINYYMKNGKSFFREVSGKINLKNLIADIEDFKMSSSRTSGAMVARYNIHNKKASAAARFAFIPSGYNTPIYLQTRSSGDVNNLDTTFDIKQITDFIDQIFAIRKPSKKSSGQRSGSIRDVN